MARWLTRTPLLLLLASASVHAQTDDERARAREQFGAGVSRYEAGDYQGALESFQEAYRLAPHPVVRVNMANCYEHLNRPLEAIHHFERFLAEAESPSRAQRREVEGAIRRLSALVGEVRFTIAPDGALVTIDSSETRRSPITETMRMTAGTHVIEARLDGYAPQRQEIQVTGGQVTRVEVRLVRAGVASATPPATVTPPTEPVAAEPTQAQAVEPAVEPEPAQGTAEVALAEPTAVEEAVVAPSSGGGFELRLTTPVLIAGGATAALTLATIITGIVSVSANGDFEAAVLRSNDASLTPADRALARDQGMSAASTASTTAVMTDIFLVSSIVAAGATVFFVILGADEASRERQASERGPALALVPAASRDGAGLSLFGRF